MSKVLKCGIWSEDDEASTEEDTCSYDCRAQSAAALDRNQSPGRDKGMGGDPYACSCSCGRAETAEEGQGARSHNQSNMLIMVGSGRIHMGPREIFSVYAIYSAGASDFKMQTIGGRHSIHT